MKSHTMTFNLDKKLLNGDDSLGELLTKAVRIISHYDDWHAARVIADCAIRAVCRAVIRERADFPYWKLPGVLHVDLAAGDNASNHNEIDASDDDGDWWKQSGYSRN